jgi:hypothetical protein
MAMRATTVRFSDDLWALLEQEAAAAGVSAAQFVRDATVLRIAYLMGRRGEPGIESTIARLTGHPETENGPVPPANVLAAVRDVERLRALRDTGLLDSANQESFDRHARIASEALDAPVALVSLSTRTASSSRAASGCPSRGRASARRRSAIRSASTRSRRRSRCSSPTRASIRSSRTTSRSAT